MKPTTKLILTILHVIAWIIFLGLCIKTGALLYSFFVTLVINPEGAKNLYMGLNLSSLYNFDIGDYAIVASLIIILSGAKAFLFYLVIKIFLKINLVAPFSKDVSLLISQASCWKRASKTPWLSGHGFIDKIPGRSTW